MIRPIDEGYQLLHEGVVALSEIEANGIRIDERYLKKALFGLDKKIAALREELKEGKVYRLWRKRYGAKANIDSREQLGTVIFKDMGETHAGKTRTGRYSTNRSALETLDVPFVKKYLTLQKLVKTRSTYLLGIQRETIGGFLHPVFNLHTVVTYRSSSDSPNFQNMPERDSRISSIVKRCFIARPGHILVDCDFKGIEVGVAACYNKDPVLISYLKDPRKDMHRDMAMQLFFLKKREVTKEIRHAAKNQFVFPQFYGDWYLNCARGLWEYAERNRLKGPDGKPLLRHLRKHGIGELGALDSQARPEPGTFEYHVRQVENNFWHRRFRVYNKWRERWWKNYIGCGYFKTLTGFRVLSVLPRNAVINYPVQGSAFHCLLWSLIQISKEMKRKRMKSKIVGQIHDSITADIHLDEIDDYLEIVHEVTNVRLRAKYPWIIVPLVIEYEFCPIGASWFEKRPVVREGRGRWSAPGVSQAKSAARLIRILSDNTE